MPIEQQDDTRGLMDILDEFDERIENLEEKVKQLIEAHREVTALLKEMLETVASASKSDE